MRPVHASYATRATGTHLRVRVRDAAGIWRDLTTYPGFNSVAAATWSEDVDSPHATASVSLLREASPALSLSPLNEASALNRGFAVGGTSSPLLDVGRELTIEVAVLAMDRPPDTADWLMVFHGRIDTLDPAPDLLSLSCRDLGGELASRWIEEDRVYAGGDLPSVSFRIWEPGVVYAAGERVVPSDAQRNSRYYSSSGGTSGNTEPVWPTPPDPAATTVSDGSITWTTAGTLSTAGHPVEQVMQALLNDNPPASGPVTLYVLGAPGWVILAYAQERQSVLDALRALALQIGWDVRYRWDAGSASFRLTLFEPQRTKTTIDYEFGPSDYEELSALTLDVAGIRNVVRLVYSDRSDLDPTGQPKRKRIQVEDAPSIARYGRLWMEIGEAYASQIDTATEAQRMANAALADLRDMRVTQEVTLLGGGFPWAELGDLYRFHANGAHYTSDLDVAVYSASHSAANGELTTSLVCRGKPSGGYVRWHVAIASDRLDQPPSPTAVYTTLSATILTAAAIVGGLRLDVTPASLDKGAAPVEYEWHLSRNSALFVPTASTLLGTSSARFFEVSNLIPGALYYAKVVPRTRVNGELVRGQPSESVAVVAGRAKIGHLTTTAASGLTPPNPGFEDLGGAELADHWLVSGGAWGTDVGHGIDSGGGRSVVLYGSAAASAVQSAAFPIHSSGYFNLEVVYRTSGPNPGLAQLQAVVYFYVTPNGTPSFIPSSTIYITNASLGIWSSYQVRSQSIPSDANYVVVELRKSVAAPTWVVEIERVELVRYDIDQQNWISPALQNGWVDYGSGFSEAAYFRDSLGVVHLRGLVKSGTVGWSTGVIFTLPTGYRPSRNQVFATLSNDALGRCTINSTGQVIAEVGSAVWFALDGITFRTS